jgi:hypothetical protein
MIAGMSLGCFGVLPAILHITNAPEISVVVAIGLGAVVYASWAWKSRAKLQLDVFGNSLRRRRAH